MYPEQGGLPSEGVLELFRGGKSNFPIASGRRLLTVVHGSSCWFRGTARFSPDLGDSRWPPERRLPVERKPPRRPRNDQLPARRPQREPPRNRQVRSALRTPHS